MMWRKKQQVQYFLEIFTHKYYNKQLFTMEKITVFYDKDWLAEEWEMEHRANHLETEKNLEQLQLECNFFCRNVK